MKSILVHINDDDGLEGRLQSALDIARTFDGHVTCLQAVSFEVFAPGDIYGSVLEAAMPVIKENAAKLREKIEADLANEDVSWDWIFQYGMAEHRLLEQSAIHDLVVVGSRDIGENDPRTSHLVGDLVMRARTPVLVVPQGQTGFDCSGPAMVAWNGSTEASIALRAAVPILRKASKVTLATVTEEDERQRFDLPPTDGAEYLSRHGVESEMVDIPKGDAPVSDTLLSAARARGCSYMVMGAYGHSRLAELLWGGVTHRALSDPQIPIVIAH
ncbi:universal stress protein [Altererythrobacter sp.]|uniref:universal stress protein n=1 Tax=Altererythrobacter sp. TaxID=1872480 RepID=UPI003D06981F